MSKTPKTPPPVSNEPGNTTSSPPEYEGWNDAYGYFDAPITCQFCLAEKVVSNMHNHCLKNQCVVECKWCPYEITLVRCKCGCPLTETRGCTFCKLPAARRMSCSQCSASGWAPAGEIPFRWCRAPHVEGVLCGDCDPRVST